MSLKEDGRVGHLLYLETKIYEVGGQVVSNVPISFPVSISLGRCLLAGGIGSGWRCGERLERLDDT